MSDEGEQKYLDRPQVDSPADVLRRAKALIRTPDMWHQGGASNWAYKAHTFCAWYAVRTALYGELYSGDFYSDSAAWRHLLTAVGECPIAFNDRGTTTHADVMAAFDRAIALAEAG